MAGPRRGAGAAAAALLLPWLLAAAPAAAAPTRADGGIRFTYQDPNARSVAWAGAFNDWNGTAHPMQKDAAGTWSIVLPLPAGEHEYKFVVDGQWIADPENPVTRGDYGNSVVNVAADGSIVAVQATSNTPYNPRIFVGGRVIGLYQMLRNTENRRFELRRPHHDIDLRFDIRMSDVLKARFLMNIDSEAQATDFFRSSLNFDRGSLELSAPRLELMGFDNDVAAQWDDPLRLVGGIGIYDHAFGYGLQGFRARSRPWGIDAEVLYSDNFEPGGSGYVGFATDPTVGQLGRFPTTAQGGGFVLMPGTFIAEQVVSISDGNENTFAARLRRDVVPGLTLGLLGRQDRGFNLGSISHLEATGPRTLRQVVGTVDQQWLAGGAELRWKAPAGFAAFGEFLRGEHRVVPVGAVQIAWHVDSADASGIRAASGSGSDAIGRHLRLDASNRFRLGGSWAESHGDVRLQLDVERQTHDYDVFHADLDNAMTVWRLGWDRNWRYYLNREVRTRLEVEFTDFDYRAGTPWNRQLWFPHANFWLDHGEHRVSVDRLVLLGGDDVLSIRPGIEIPLHRRRNASFRWDGTFNGVDLGTVPKYAESLFRLGVDLTPSLRLGTDTRWVKYDDPVLRLDDGYVDHFVEVAYRFAPGIQLAVSYGVDPEVIDPVTNEWARIGRDQYLFARGANGATAETDYYGLGARLAAAERAMRDERRFGAKATVNF